MYNLPLCRPLYMRAISTSLLRVLYWAACEADVLGYPVDAPTLPKAETHS